MNKKCKIPEVKKNLISVRYMNMSLWVKFNKQGEELSLWLERKIGPCKEFVFYSKCNRKSLKGIRQGVMQLV